MISFLFENHFHILIEILNQIQWHTKKVKVV